MKKIYVKLKEKTANHQFELGCMCVQLIKISVLFIAVIGLIKICVHLLNI